MSQTPTTWRPNQSMWSVYSDIMNPIRLSEWARPPPTLRNWEDRADMLRYIAKEQKKSFNKYYNEDAHNLTYDILNNRGTQQQQTERMQQLIKSNFAYKAQAIRTSLDRGYTWGAILITRILTFLGYKETKILRGMENLRSDFNKFQGQLHGEIAGINVSTADAKNAVILIKKAYQTALIELEKVQKDMDEVKNAVKLVINELEKVDNDVKDALQDVVEDLKEVKEDIKDIFREILDELD